MGDPESPAGNARPFARSERNEQEAPPTATPESPPGDGGKGQEASASTPDPKSASAPGSGEGSSGEGSSTPEGTAPPSVTPPATPPLVPAVTTSPPPGTQSSVSVRQGTTEPAPATNKEEKCAPTEDPKHKFTSMVLIEGVGRYGGFVEGENLEDEDAPTTSFRAGGLGAQATLGFIPGGKTFMLAGRLYGGAYLGSDITSGTIGAAVLFGANLARKATGRTFSYVLGGFGVEYLPQKKQDILTLHISGGTVVRGLDFGVDIDLGGNDEFARFMLGMHFGWGRLF